MENEPLVFDLPTENCDFPRRWQTHGFVQNDLQHAGFSTLILVSGGSSTKHDR